MLSVPVPPSRLAKPLKVMVFVSISPEFTPSTTKLSSAAEPVKVASAPLPIKFSIPLKLPVAVVVLVSKFTEITVV